MLTKNPVWRVFARDPVSEETRTTIGLSPRKALYGITTGEGRFENFNKLVVTAYTSIVLAEQGYGVNEQEDFYAALVAILECRVRSLRGESYSLSEHDAVLVDEMLQLHEQQVHLATKAELASATLEAYQRAKVAG